jgi:prophage antirepressor-like protein
MSTQIQMFRYEHDNQLDRVRTVEIDGEIWFVAADVAKVLGYSNARDAIKRHCRDRGVVKRDIPTQSGIQAVTLINEPNIYRLIVKSQLPSAEQFEQWLFEEVIPSIRKTGSYGIDRRKTSNFVQRYFLNFDKVKQGTFSVITELYVRLYGRLEHAGYIIPDKGLTGKEIRPDISVGKCFASYLRERYPSAPQEFETYTHSFESGLEVEARLYPIDLISIFIRYVDEVWIPKNAEAYFKDRDRKALDFLPKLLPAYC